MSFADVPTSRSSTPRNPGIAYGLSAYALWGALPLYLRPLGPRVSPMVIVAHRVVWSVGLLVILLTVMKLWPTLRAVIRTPRTLGLLALSTIFISLNWFTFTYANTTGHGVDAALGYFITPILSALIGLAFLNERLSWLKWIAFALAAGAVGYLTYAQGRLPLIALILAVTFALYGLVRKLTPVDALVGLAIETAFLFPLAIPFLVHARSTHVLGGNPAPGLLIVLAIGCSLFTTIPLLLFTKAARLLPLTTIGFLQYVGPTGQFLIAVFCFGERFTPERRIAFPAIWLAVIIFLVDVLRSRSWPGRKAPDIEEPV